MEKDKLVPMNMILEASHAMVGEVHGEAECLVITSPGVLRHQQSDLPFSCVAGVTTSRIARKQGLARRVLAQSLARDVSNGAIVAGLSMFEQGYYDLLGFGTGGYEIWATFDPSTLRIPITARTPIRLGKKDRERMHAARLARMRKHGSVNLTHPNITYADLEWAKNGFGLGYEENGELTHFFYCQVEEVEFGPYTVWFSTYRTHDQLLELLALIQSLGDQVHAVHMQEPPGIQIQDFLQSPFRLRRKTEKGKFASRLRASAYWQIRILDLKACLEKTELPCDPLRFNLVLSDPITDSLPEDSTWTGIAGKYVVELGASSSARPGEEASLPTLTASVGAFSRMWLGALPATSIAVSDTLSGPHELLESLDEAFRITRPQPDWLF